MLCSRLIMYTWLLSFSYISNLSVLVDRVSSFSIAPSPCQVFELPEKPEGSSEVNATRSREVQRRNGTVAATSLYPVPRKKEGKLEIGPGICGRRSMRMKSASFFPASLAATALSIVEVGLSRWSRRARSGPRALTTRDFNGKRKKRTKQTKERVALHTTTARAWKKEKGNERSILTTTMTVIIMMKVLVIIIK